MSAFAPFYLATAFTELDSPVKGNPALVVVLDNVDLPSSTLQGIAINFNQPMAMFVSPASLPSQDPAVVAFRVRWFSLNDEIPQCGHATLAAAKVIFEQPELASQQVEVIEFHGIKSGILTARKLDGGFIEIKLRGVDVQEVSSDIRNSVPKVLATAFGRELAINNVVKAGIGLDKQSFYLCIELSPEEDIEKCAINVDALSGLGRHGVIITKLSSDKNARFVSRVFVGDVPGGEDHACGSAHSILVPYWYAKLGITGGTEVEARQVGPRGSHFKVVHHVDADGLGIVSLQGKVVVLAKGNLELF